MYDFGRAGELYYLLMECIDGLNVRQMMRARKLTPREALAIVPQVCEALQYAHDEGVVHRDIKPENILLDRKGRVKIADFGLARLLGRETAATRLTQSQDVMGTPQYMAPEQFEKPLEVDHRADIYSLGVVFYEMLTGELPLGRFDPPSRKVQVDVRLDEVVLQALAKEPARRYQQASEVKTRVETIAAVPAPGGQTVATYRSLRYEYKSPHTLFGLPLLHVAWGQDPVTRKPLVARGILAIGSVAKGVLALGLFACGGVAIGPLAVGGIGFGALSAGLVAIGAAAFGVVACGAVAVGLGMAMGAVAVGAVAQGALAVGYHARGAVAVGVHAITNGQIDPAAREVFAALGSLKALRVLFKGLPGLIIILALAFPFTFILIQQWLRRQNGLAQGQSPPGSGPAIPGAGPHGTVPMAGRVASAGAGGTPAGPQGIGGPAIGFIVVGILCLSLCAAVLIGVHYASRAPETTAAYCLARLPGKGEFFSKGFPSAITGTTGWTAVETPFFLTEADQPDLLRLNLVVEGPGTAGIKDVGLFCTPP